MTILLANYRKERDLFHALVSEDCHQRILLLRGASGTGKTSLLNACREELINAVTQVMHVPIQLRQSAVTVAEIFYRLGYKLGWEQLPTFTKKVSALQSQSTVNIEKNQMWGQNHISVALQAENPNDRAQLRAALTDACFMDLRKLTKPLLIIFDTYEAASTDVQQWIDGPFLARASENPRVRVLIAGQEIPQRHNIEWGHCCLSQDLYGISQAEHWLPVVKALHKRIDAPDPLSWLAGICHALKGQPSAIMQVIEALTSFEVQA